ncbi:MAG: hypothetical protein HC880_11775 [Bacteroidia bacterium]|nr:hypothetical protein [Bacteroidia bacterium]
MCGALADPKGHLVVDPQHTLYWLTPYAGELSDSSGLCQIAGIHREAFRARLAPYLSHQDREASHWLRLRLYNPSPKPQNWYLVAPFAEYFQVYVPSEADQATFSYFKNGFCVPFAEQSFQNRHDRVLVTLPARQLTDLFLMVRANQQFYREKTPCHVLRLERADWVRHQILRDWISLAALLGI